ncbi:protein SHQ1 homolog [Nephila pilipes]|uniref:Protein SHQ1 homolog n=1 Tax=Nephila pilipes TaxID=299642 RepID=A0A8X6MW26_NEPPI|nr:protein SHQ1 homolog [Nephila pilipes]
MISTGCKNYNVFLIVIQSIKTPQLFWRAHVIGNSTMLTPAFDLTQNEEFLVISIQVPYAKFSEVEIDYDDYSFMFYCKPYYLRLNLPGKVVCCEKPVYTYDVDKRIFTIHAAKAHKGEVFIGLDLINNLLDSKKGKSVGIPKIEILESTDDVQESEEVDWSIEQVPSKDEFGHLKIFGKQCGFANSYSFSVFEMKEEAREIFDVTDPECKNRFEERLQKESECFNDEHYLADLFEDEEVQRLIHYKPDWVDLHDEVQNNISEDKIQFTSEEKDRMRKLPSKEYLLDKAQCRTAFLSLIDILFAYAYNKRTTEGENNVESAWTINKISAALCWLETFTSISEVAMSCIRRSLIYPLYRHFELSVTVLEDVRKIIVLGRKYIIKCLLEIHEMFNLSEPRYILNDLFIVDYIVWLQTKSCRSKELVSLAASLEKVLLTKGDIGLNLVDIETLARVAWMSRDTLLNSSNSANNKEQKPNIENSKSQNSTDTAVLCSNLEKLSLDANNQENVEVVSSANESDSEYEVCSSCTSDSSDSDSSSYESEIMDSDDSDNASDSDDDTENSDGDDLYCRLLGAAIEE